ncbi:hypothetical protein B0J12DRAFT_164645 [Macrophomina phaseolina]|uniref:Uncharacterized protein n=1 Tax=Macrophomina phaseolina TaxID=35725 RepID=A0ABQ8GS10_9PEZI|nr:hypothetical protein B0J12DRAFT_164645 [Macrophomina phaseolina]
MPPATATTTTTTTTSNPLRPTLPTHLLSGRSHGPDAGRRITSSSAHRAAPSDHSFDAYHDDDDDGIPLMPLSRVQSVWQASPGPPPPAYSEFAHDGGGDDHTNNKSNKGKGRGSRGRRVYRYVSHGIGGAGNFRKCSFHIQFCFFAHSFLSFFFFSPLSLSVS